MGLGDFILDTCVSSFLSAKKFVESGEARKVCENIGLISKPIDKPKDDPKI